MSQSEKIEKRYKLLAGLGTLLLTLVTGLWTFWGVSEMYYEGWGQPFPLPLAYLIPGVVSALFTIIVLTWPRLGGWLIAALGLVFTAWWWGMAANRGELTAGFVLSTFPVSGILVLAGVLFILIGRFRQRLLESGWTPPDQWLRRNLSYVIALGIPGLVALGLSVYYLPGLLARVDDGERGARLIEGNGVRLVWAPLGPGWNWKQPWGGYPSWRSLALYGLQPTGLEEAGSSDARVGEAEMQETGLCGYLDADGLSLMDEPQDIWRMPTVDEVLRSLALHGENSGCAWEGGTGRADCSKTPDKETPLWAPDMEPIYYWTGEEFDQEEAYYVSYNGWVGEQPKDWGNPRHGYRCVRAP
jgi:hypothetical protein